MVACPKNVTSTCAPLTVSIKHCTSNTSRVLTEVVCILFGRNQGTLCGVPCQDVLGKMGQNNEDCCTAYLAGMSAGKSIKPKKWSLCGVPFQHFASQIKRALAQENKPVVVQLQANRHTKAVRDEAEKCHAFPGTEIGIQSHTATGMRKQSSDQGQSCTCPCTEGNDHRCCCRHHETARQLRSKLCPLLSRRNRPQVHFQMRVDCFIHMALPGLSLYTHQHKTRPRPTNPPAPQKHTRAHTRTIKHLAPQTHI